MKKDKDYKKVLDSLKKDFGWADTKDMSYMEKELVNDVIRAAKKLTIPDLVGRSEQLKNDLKEEYERGYNDGIKYGMAASGRR